MKKSKKGEGPWLAGVGPTEGKALQTVAERGQEISFTEQVQGETAGEK